jgi:hypothetical protein
MVIIFRKEPVVQHQDRWESRVNSKQGYHKADIAMLIDIKYDRGTSRIELTIQIYEGGRNSNTNSLKNSPPTQTIEGYVNRGHSPIDTDMLLSQFETVDFTSLKTVIESCEKLVKSLDVSGEVAMQDCLRPAPSPSDSIYQRIWRSFILILSRP